MAYTPDIQRRSLDLIPIHIQITMNDVKESAPITKTSFLKKKWFWTTVLPPIITLVGGFFGGKEAEKTYIIHQAQNNISVNTNTFTTIVQEAVQETRAAGVSQAITTKLGTLEDLAKSIELDTRLLRTDNNRVSTQSDFWIPIHKTATAGVDQASLSVEYDYGSDGHIDAIYNGKSMSMRVGDYTPPFRYSDDGLQAQYIYSERLDSAGLYGFRIKYLPKTGH